jgi:hypothetical protein
VSGFLFGRKHPEGGASPFLFAVCLVLVSSGLSGCFVYEVASAPVKVVAKTVQIAGTTTVAIVESSGKVAVSAVRATGAVATGGIETSARLARAGMVTFSDQATGLVVRVPWERGLTLLDASNAAKMDVGRSALRLVRDGKPADLGVQPSRGTLVLHSGDVVQVES